MAERIISMIAAIDQKGGIGKNGRIPWEIPGELKYFKDTTMNSPIIMGRKTHESIGRTLPGRENIVITRDLNYQAKPGAVVVHSLKEGIEYAGVKSHSEVFIIGGGEIYSQAISVANRLYLTVVQGDYEADVFFPEFSSFGKVIKEDEYEVSDEKKTYKYMQLILEK